MKKNIITLLVLVICFASCKSRKAISDKQRIDNVKRASTELKNGTKNPKTRISVEPLSKKSSEFITFKIDSAEEYIATFAETAQQEMRDYGIPASITLAQGLLESGIGKGALALKTNNHFGIKCHAGWEGDSELHDDDEKDECFRKYNHPMYSFRDHSIFLTSRARYDFLFKLRPTDYKSWAKGLKKAGYATDPKYPKKLISLIERFKLYSYDKKYKRHLIKQTKIIANPTYETHSVAKGDTLYSLSRKYNMTIDELKKINALGNSNLEIGQSLKVRSININ